MSTTHSSFRDTFNPLYQRFEVKDMSELCRWGRLETPHPDRLELKKGRELKQKRGALRVVLFGSAVRGQMVLSELIDAAREDPETINIVGLATDDVEHGRISRRRRLYQYLDDADAKYLEKLMCQRAIAAGIPVFTGSVKSPYFQREILDNDWKPDVILGATFGQLVPPEVIKRPTYGTYNLHPSDLARGKHPGPNPFKGITDADESYTRMTLHQMDAGFDTGDVVGYSPEICLRLEDGSYPTNLRMHERTGVAAARMAVEFMYELAKLRRRVESMDLETIFTSEEVADFAAPMEHRKIDDWSLETRHYFTVRGTTEIL